MPRRFQQVRNANGGETEYWFLTITFIFENFGRFLFFVNKMAWDWYYKLKHSLLNAELNSLQDRIRIFFVPFTQFAVGVGPIISWHPVVQGEHKVTHYFWASITHQSIVVCRWSFVWRLNGPRGKEWPHFEIPCMWTLVIWSSGHFKAVT
jgi:hypothetical protein